MRYIVIRRGARSADAEETLENIREKLGRMMGDLERKLVPET